MFCRRCDYLLFHLKRPVCPECGSAFDLDEYQFEPGDVEFCCPDCEKAYPGDSGTGLPSWEHRTCEGCGRSLHRNQMMVRPLKEDAIGFGLEPEWARDDGGFWNRWWRTLMYVLFRPRQFFRRCRTDQPESSTGFMILNFFIGYWGVMISLSLFGFIYEGVAFLLVGFVMLTLGSIFALLMLYAVSLALALYASIAVFLINPSQRASSFDRIMDIIGYSAAGLVLFCIPGVGWILAPIWTTVLLIVGLSEVFRISRLAASVAVLWPLITAGVVFFGLLR